MVATIAYARRKAAGPLSPSYSVCSAKKTRGETRAWNHALNPWTRLKSSSVRAAPYPGAPIGGPTGIAGACGRDGALSGPLHHSQEIPGLENWWHRGHW